MSEVPFPPCEYCRRVMPHPPEWFVCPEEGHAHVICVSCVVEWDIGDLSSGKGQVLTACPIEAKDARDLAEELMAPASEPKPWETNPVRTITKGDAPHPNPNGGDLFQRTDGTTCMYDGQAWVEIGSPSL